MMKDASANPGSRFAIPVGTAHGTDIFRDNPSFAVEIADWLLRSAAGTLSAPATRDFLDRRSLTAR